MYQGTFAGHVIASRTLINVVDVSLCLKPLRINLAAGQSASCARANNTVCPLRRRICHKLSNTWLGLSIFFIFVV